MKSDSFIPIWIKVYLTTATSALPLMSSMAGKRPHRLVSRALWKALRLPHFSPTRRTCSLELLVKSTLRSWVGSFSNSDTSETISVVPDQYGLNRELPDFRSASASSIKVPITDERSFPNPLCSLGELGLQRTALSAQFCNSSPQLICFPRL